MSTYSQINYNVMLDTKHQYETDPELQEAVYISKSRQYIVLHEENIDQPKADDSSTKYVVSGKRSFEAAKDYIGKKVAVLNFANNHSVGRGPFSANAQEESLCRCSTLYPCLEAMKTMFHDKHRYQYERGEINYMGNDDLIYTPDVVVFKTDERTDPIYPKMMPRKDWYLSMSSVIICSLLHDVCKHDNYYIGSNGKPTLDRKARAKGHGRRSVFIVKRGCQLPLNYDEEMAIWWHMCEYEVSKDRFNDEYEESKNIALCRLIQQADGIAARTE